MKKYAIIDIGSNTIRLCVYKVTDVGFSLVAKKRSVAGLASYVDKKGNLREDGIKKLIAVLESFKTVYEPLKVTKVLPFATASLRLVKNKEQIVKRIQKETGLLVKVLRGSEEAKLSFEGARSNLGLKSGLLVDIGGASTELVYFKNGNLVKAYSFPLGSLSCYERYVSRVIPTRIEQERIKRDILEAMDVVDLPDAANKLPIVCVGGSVRNAGKIYQTIYGESENEMSYENFKDILQQFRAEKKEYLDIILKVAPHRIHTLIPGMIILKTIAKYFKSKKLIISKYGIREGYFLSQLNK